MPGAKEEGRDRGKEGQSPEDLPDCLAVKIAPFGHECGHKVITIECLPYTSEDCKKRMILFYGNVRMNQNVAQRGKKKTVENVPCACKVIKQI